MHSSHVVSLDFEPTALEVAIPSDPSSAMKTQLQHGDKFMVQVKSHGFILLWMFI